MKYDKIFNNSLKREVATNPGAPAGVTMHNAKCMAEKTVLETGLASMKKASRKSQLEAHLNYFTEFVIQMFEMAGVLGAEILRLGMKLVGFAVAVVTAYALSSALSFAIPEVAKMEQGLNELLSSVQASGFSAQVLHYWQSFTSELSHANVAVLLGMFSVPTQCLLWFKLFRLNRRFPMRRKTITCLGQLLSLGKSEPRTMPKLQQSEPMPMAKVQKSA